jgi:hypothetical protein
VNASTVIIFYKILFFKIINIFHILILLDYFETGFAACARCHYTCADCQGGIQINQCIDCGDPSINHRTLSNGYCNCNDGYYDTKESIECGNCHVSCQTCTMGDASSCVLCPVILFIIL